MFSTPSESVTLANIEQFENADPPITVKFDGILIFVNAEQPENAATAIAVKLSGNPEFIWSGVYDYRPSV